VKTKKHPENSKLHQGNQWITGMATVLGSWSWSASRTFLSGLGLTKMVFLISVELQLAGQKC